MLNQMLSQNQEMTPVLLVIGELNVNSAIFGWLFAVEVLSTGRLLRHQAIRPVIAECRDHPLSVCR